jgi:invasion protein IalB
MRQAPSRLLAAFCAIVAASSAATVALAQVTKQQTTDAAASSGTIEKSGDWELVCTPSLAQAASGTHSAASCRLIQNHANADGKTVLLVTMLSSAVAKGPVAVVSVPKGVYLAPGIELKVDGGQGFKLLYETCNDNGCHAGYKVTGDIGTALKKGRVAAHKIYDAKQQPFTVDVSLHGLGKGLDRLAEVSK